ncbi:MAG: UDP-N-acetylmuramoyl-L-alanyl-D-glutamate--2,6-diaminopimelate ligase [Hyphomicrobiaceae bacterium]|nr:UDP-N-acetylmuramoyl-L-alanyl-D-glutamate--2,6-diaminopimelate ligase [Hyphomicrobiaceae bacterium]
MARPLATLVPSLGHGPASGLTITGISADSRTVGPGFLFAALPGVREHGMAHARAAVAGGAVAILTDAAVPEPENLGGVPVIRVDNPRRELALAAARFHASQPDCVVAVTGTSGKTSVVEFTRQILAHAGHKAASLGTIGVVKPDGATYGSLTTPDPVSLHATLAGLANEGVTHLAFEASSHGLDQHRLDGVRLAAAAFTNLGRDHMDYHPTVEAYFAAKMRLFDDLLPPGRPVVINSDGAKGEAAAAVAQARGHHVLSVGRSGKTLRLIEAAAHGFSQRLTIETPGRTYDIPLPLIGAYQVENALVAAGLAMAVGMGTEEAIRALATLNGVPGRLEIVGQVHGALIVVDYAHKPEALAAALAGVRPFVTGRLRLVFGCGGDRDRGKRPIMGAIAAAEADRVIITDDNPRTEEPAAIRTEILAGIVAAEQRCTKEVGDRRAAILEAVASAQPGDVVLIAGKGHETGQIIGREVLPFDDRDVAREAMAEVAR